MYYTEDICYKTQEVRQPLWKLNNQHFGSEKHWWLFFLAFKHSSICSYYGFQCPALLLLKLSFETIHISNRSASNYHIIIERIKATNKEIEVRGNLFTTELQSFVIHMPKLQFIYRNLQVFLSFYQPYIPLLLFHSHSLLPTWN